MTGTFTNVEVTERTQITPQGKVAKVYKVTAVTLSGTLLSVDVDEKDFHPDKVKEILAAKALEIENIKALGG